MAYAKTRPWGNVKPSVGSQVNWADSINTGLTGCYLLNETSGGIAKNIAGLHDGILRNSPARTVGKFGDAVSFDGSNDYIELSSTILKAYTSCSITAWIRGASFASLHGIVSDWAGTNSVLFRVNGGSLQFFLSTPGVVGGDLGFTMVAGVWYFVAATYDGATIRGYRNGIAGATTYAQTGAIQSTAAYIGIGGPNRTSSEGPFSGVIDNVRIYRRALRHAEAQRLYAEPFAGITSPVLRMRSGPAAAPGSFKAAWANNRNSILGAVVR